MNRQKHKYREGTRAARFLAIRDAILAQSHHMRQINPGRYELAVGPFLIHYSIPGSLGLDRPFNIAIWPGAAENAGHIVQANKVANVDWDQWDKVDIIAYRSGEWEKELLDLLASPIAFLPRR